MRKFARYLLAGIVIITLIYFINKASAELRGVEFELPVPTTNFSLVNVNNSLYWQGHTGTDGSWLTGISTFNLTYQNKAGTGNCPDGYVVMNTTTGGVQCIALSSIYYAPSQSANISGTVQGTLSLVNHTDGLYDGKTLNITESSGSPALDVRMNFTGIDSFNEGILRYYTSTLIGAYPVIEVWDYIDSAWEDYPPLSTTLTYSTITQPVFDATRHISGGIVQMRIYKASNGNVNNKYYVDWVAIAKGFGTPSGQETDPYSIHTTALNYSFFNYTNGLLQWIGGFTNSTYSNLLNQNCPSGKVVNGTNSTGSFICTTDLTGGGNRFNQELNTTNDVEFNKVTTIELNATYIYVGDGGITCFNSGGICIFSMGPAVTGFSFSGGGLQDIGNVVTNLLTYSGSDPMFETFYPITSKQAIEYVGISTPEDKRGGGTFFYNIDRKQLEWIDQNTMKIYKVQMQELENISIRWNYNKNNTVYINGTTKVQYPNGTVVIR